MKKDKSSKLKNNVHEDMCNLIRIYVYIYQKYYKQADFCINDFAISAHAKKSKYLVSSVLKTSNWGSIGFEWMFTYILFQFGRLTYYKKNDPQRFTPTVFGKITPADLFKKSSVDAWMGRYATYDYAEEKHVFCVDNGISKKEIKDRVYPPVKEQDINYDAVKDSDRKLFLNEKQGMDWCMSQSIYFSSTSKICAQCRFSDKCITRES